MNETILTITPKVFGMNSPASYAIGTVVALLILGYLIYSLIRPEKFWNLQDYEKHRLLAEMDGVSVYLQAKVLLIKSLYSPDNLYKTLIYAKVIL
jgi:K+-transporting ATPase KdpF subunit